MLRQPDSKEYRVLHAAGEHVTTKTGVRLAYIWYTDEGAYAADAVGNLPEINTSFRARRCMRKAFCRPVTLTC